LRGRWGNHPKSIASPYELMGAEIKHPAEARTVYGTNTHLLAEAGCAPCVTTPCYKNDGAVQCARLSEWCGAEGRDKRSPNEKGWLPFFGKSRNRD
jgi:hypothetical protein